MTITPCIRQRSLQKEGVAIYRRARQPRRVAGKPAERIFASLTTLPLQFSFPKFDLPQGRRPAMGMIFLNTQRMRVHHHREIDRNFVWEMESSLSRLTNSILKGLLTMNHRHQHRPVKHRKPVWQEKNPSIVPFASQVALRKALIIEHVSIDQFDDFLWIMAQESAGQVDARNSVSTARGLFQLLAAQYSLNPNGADSFGDAIEECQGGIHYVMGRYHSAKAAKTFWQKHHWY